MENNQQGQTQKVNKRALKTAIIISWVVLVVCFMIKLFGGKWFEIASTNTVFSKVCAFVDNHLWLQNIVGFITSFTVIMFINLAVLKQKWFNCKQFIIVLICSIICFIPKIISDYIAIFTIVGFVADIIPVFIAPLILSKKLLRSLVGTLLYLAFQAISVAIKGLSLTTINDESLLVALIYSVDMYIMLILYYLYSIMPNKKDKNNENKVQEKEV